MASLWACSPTCWAKASMSGGRALRTGETGKTEQELEQPCSEEGVLPILAAQEVIS